MKKSNRNRLNFIIDILLFINLALLMGIGFLVKYVLISGEKKWMLYGRNEEFLFMGFDRHQWGTIHLITGILFFIFLLLHLIFHWDMIKCLFNKYLPKTGVKIAIISLCLVLFVSLVVIPFFVTPESTGVFKGRGRLSTATAPSTTESPQNAGIIMAEQEHAPAKKTETAATEKLHKNEKNHAGYEDIHVRGYMQLNEVAANYDVSATKIKKELGLPAAVSDQERLGRLKKRYSFTMSDVKEVIANCRDENQKRHEVTN